MALSLMQGALLGFYPQPVQMGMPSGFMPAAAATPAQMPAGMMAPMAPVSVPAPPAFDFGAVDMPAFPRELAKVVEVEKKNTTTFQGMPALFERAAPPPAAVAASEQAVVAQMPAQYQQLAEQLQAKALASMPAGVKSFNANEIVTNDGQRITLTDLIPAEIRESYFSKEAMEIAWNGIAAWATYNTNMRSYYWLLAGFLDAQLVTWGQGEAKEFDFYGQKFEPYNDQSTKYMVTASSYFKLLAYYHITSNAYIVLYDRFVLSKWWEEPDLMRKWRGMTAVWTAVLFLNWAYYGTVAHSLTIYEMWVGAAPGIQHPTQVMTNVSNAVTTIGQGVSNAAISFTENMFGKGMKQSLERILGMNTMRSLERSMGEASTFWTSTNFAVYESIAGVFALYSWNTEVMWDMYDLHRKEGARMYDMNWAGIGMSLDDTITMGKFSNDLNVIWNMLAAYSMVNWAHLGFAQPVAHAIVPALLINSAASGFRSAYYAARLNYEAGTYPSTALAGAGESANVPITAGGESKRKKRRVTL